MKKIKVKLKAEIARRRDGFYDLSEGQKIAPTSDKPEKEVFEVLETPFIVSKIRSGELIPVVSRRADTGSASGNENAGSDDDNNNSSDQNDDSDSSDDDDPDEASGADSNSDDGNDPEGE